MTRLFQRCSYLIVLAGPLLSSLCTPVILIGIFVGDTSLQGRFSFTSWSLSCPERTYTWTNIQSTMVRVVEDPVS